LLVFSKNRAPTYYRALFQTSSTPLGVR